MLQRECALRGRCDVGSYYEYLYYYQTSPSEAQTIDAYRRALSAMLHAGDFSSLGYTNSPGIPGFSMIFGGRMPFGRSEDTATGTDPPPPKRKPAENA